jgi:hypothetical protein
MSTISLELVNAILAYASLPPHRLLSSLVVLGTFVTACEYARISLIVESPRSRPVHVALCMLTFAFQAIAMAAMLVYADIKYHGRGFINLAIVAGAYILWYLVGQSTRLVRRDSEGADVGFMSFGALITFPVGIVAALLTRE